MGLLRVGDQEYASAVWVPPMAYYPKARLADYLVGTIRQFYLHAQFQGRFIGSTNYGFNLRDVSAEANSVTKAIFSNVGDHEFPVIHSGRRTLPRETSHVRAWVAFSVVDAQKCITRLRVTVKDATHTDTADSPDIFTENLIPRVDRIGNLNSQSGRGENPFTARFATFLTSVGVQLVNIPQDEPKRCQTQVGGFAFNQFQPTHRRGFQPLFVACYAEMHYGDDNP